MSSAKSIPEWLNAGKVNASTPSRNVQYNPASSDPTEDENLSQEGLNVSAEHLASAPETSEDIQEAQSMN